MPARKKIEWVVDESGCHNCTSHHKDRNGYTVLCFNNKRIKHHRHVYSITYLNGGAIPNGMVVRHKCDNPNCINPEHLELGTPYENAMDRLKRNRQPFGSKNGRAKVLESDIVDIRKSKISTSELAKKYGISYNQLWKIRNGKAWKFIN